MKKILLITIVLIVQIFSYASNNEIVNREKEDVKSKENTIIPVKYGL